MSPRNCKVHDEWFTRTDSRGSIISKWCVKMDGFTVMCNICTTKISCKAKGYQAILQHASCKNHEKNCKIKLDPLQLTLSSSSQTPVCSSVSSTAIQPQITVNNSKESSTKAEILWALKVVQSNFAAASCDNIGAVFSAMFPDTEISFNMARTKCGYVINEALGPFFRNSLLEDIGNCFFTIMFDETVNAEKVKELQVLIRYFSNSQNRVITSHLETFFISYADAETVVAFLKKAIDNAGLSILSLIMLGSDGPNVNKKIFRILNEQLKCDRGWGLVDIGTCNVHLVHNAFLKGLAEFGEDVSDMIIQTYLFFDGWPTRVEDYKSIQDMTKVPQNHFIKHVSSRWLTIGPAAERLLEQWPALVHYFLVHLPKKSNNKQLLKSSKYKNIVQYLTQKDMKAQVYYVIESASFFTKFTEFYQRDEPLIHLLYEHLRRLVLLIASKVCKKYDSLTGVLESTNMLNPKDVVIDSQKCNDIISKFSEKDKLVFLNCVQKHYKAALTYLVTKTQVYFDILKDLTFLQPELIKSKKSVNRVKGVISKIKLWKNEGDVTDEWRLLQIENLPKYNCENIRIDEYWAEIFNNVKLKEVAKLVKASLIISHSNAEVERGFSKSKLVLDYGQAAMSCRTLNARMNCISGLKLYDNRVECVPITKDLVKQARMAHKHYQLYLENQKQTEEEEKRKKHEEEQREELERKAAEELLKKKNTLANLNLQLATEEKAKITKQKGSDELLKEANIRLKAAMEKADMTAIHLAQGLMAGAISLREQEREADISIKKIEKRKSHLISDFFSKKLKSDN